MRGDRFGGWRISSSSSSSSRTRRSKRSRFNFEGLLDDERAKRRRSVGIFVCLSAAAAAAAAVAVAVAAGAGGDAAARVSDRRQHDENHARHDDEHAGDVEGGVVGPGDVADPSGQRRPHQIRRPLEHEQQSVRVDEAFQRYQVDQDDGHQRVVGRDRQTEQAGRGGQPGVTGAQRHGGRRQTAHQHRTRIHPRRVDPRLVAQVAQ